MKKFTTTLIASLCLMGTAQAQDSGQNYVMKRMMLNTSATSYIDNIQYYDGLGRPFQSVERAYMGGTQTGSILATLQEYDTMGRESNTWLPIGITGSYLAPAAFRSNAPGSYGSDARPYSQSVYESSPLDRLTENYRPGSAWSTKPARVEYAVNTTASPYNCIRYSVSSADAPVSNGNYAKGTLRVTKATDEDGKVLYTFTDKQGQTLLERRTNGTETLDTYYVYDDYGCLRFVLQPEYQTTANLDLYAFQYKYDNHNNCIWKKLPGAQYVTYEYDSADRMIFSQDGVQRAAGKWTFYVYDSLDRLTQQGEHTSKAVSSSGVYLQNYYDNYTSLRSAVSGNGNYPDDTSGYSRGFLTGTMTKVLGSDTRLYTAYYYDIEGHVTKKVQQNLLGGHDITTTAYSFSGRPLTVTHAHTASGKTSRTEVYTYTYDEKDRVSTVKHKLGSTEVTLANYTYDALGRQSTKKLHGSSTNQLTYSYNIQNWLTGISSTKFTQNLTYNNGTTGFNGNISSMNWNANGSSHSYTFTYDGVNRMLNATHGTGAYTEKVTLYDKNGNIKALQRYGNGLIDNLTYTYSGNQLTKVDDATGNAAGFSNGASAANEYTYDNNGNLTKDSNKGITNIAYNCLNLPSRVTFGDGSTIVYTYAADGTKLRTVHTISGTSTQKDYCANVVYENGVQKMLLTEEGYVDLSVSTPAYYYYLKDHQGNNRIVLSPGGTVAEVNHYYPFGGVFASTGNVQPYKYNGKELDTKKGLNWYDYGARHYDAALGRWLVVDPLAEKYYSTSAYGYCLNNPIKYVDPNGLSTWVMQNEDGTYRIVGGDLKDKDRNIYIYSIQDGQMVRGESIGITTSITSFYNSDSNGGKGTWAIGSVINPNDQSGNDFLSNIIGNSPAMIDDYAMNARTGHKYDFKVTNGTENAIEGIDIYRGMPIGKKANGQIVYTSARDVGNIAAGYIAGSNGMPWAAARIAFDCYQGGIEGVSTRNAEYYGWRMGAHLRPYKRMNNFKKSMKSLFKKIW